MFLAEGSIQNEQFGSIPRCLWWSIITVTTVGYGDTYPVTALGKIIASLTAICGIAVEFPLELFPQALRNHLVRRLAMKRYESFLTKTQGLTHVYLRNTSAHLVRLIPIYDLGQLPISLFNQSIVDQSLNNPGSSPNDWIILMHFEVGLQSLEASNADSAVSKG